jgi:hypothetical protein
VGDWVAEWLMFDASKYAEHFPDERQDVPSSHAVSAVTLGGPTLSHALLAALSRLEREFSEILRTQFPDATERSE